VREVRCQSWGLRECHPVLTVSFPRSGVAAAAVLAACNTNCPGGHASLRVPSRVLLGLDADGDCGIHHEP
jgi:hypothetical protein